MAIGENGRVGRILISNDDGIDAMGKAPFNSV